MKEKESESACDIRSGLKEQRERKKDTKRERKR